MVICGQVMLQLTSVDNRRYGRDKAVFTSKQQSLKAQILVSKISWRLCINCSSKSWITQECQIDSDNLKRE